VDPEWPGAANRVVHHREQSDSLFVASLKGATP
jgi:hypothetical protein